MAAAEEHDVNMRRFNDMLAAAQRRRRAPLVFSLLPLPNAEPARPFRPDDPWDGRHHVGVSRGNHELHPTHREFFTSPRAFDMCTKPRSALPVGAIVAKIAPSRGDASGKGPTPVVKVFPRPSASSVRQSSRPGPLHVQPSLSL
jgi:hypothetical protein